MKELKKYLISIIFTVIVFMIFILWDSYDIKQLKKQNKKLNERINQLETDYKLYDYNINQLKEYRGN